MSIEPFKWPIGKDVTIRFLDAPEPEIRWMPTSWEQHEGRALRCNKPPAEVHEVSEALLHRQTRIRILKERTSTTAPTVFYDARLPGKLTAYLESVDRLFHCKTRQRALQQKLNKAKKQRRARTGRR